MAKRTVNTPLNVLDENEIDLLIEGLDLLEDQPTGPANMGMENGFAGFLMGTSREEIQEQLTAKMRDAKIEIRDRKRRIALLKAKLYTAGMNQLADLFTTKAEQPTQ
jgi:hypothetical protein